MKAVLAQQRVALAFAASAVGIAVFWLTNTPLSLLAPISALFMFARGRAALTLYAASVVGLVGSLLVAAFDADTSRDVAVTWAALFAIAPCIGAIVMASASNSPNAEEMRVAAIVSAPREQAPSYPVFGPTLQEKAASRHSPFVGLSAEDDKATASVLVAASFWGGTPFHMRYWRRQPDGHYRWVESRSESSREPSGTRVWRSVSLDVDDQRPEQTPTRIAANTPSDDDAVRAAKIVENLLGNAWAFDAAGRPIYLTPFAQTFVAATLGEFQAVVDEGHTFFKRTAHPDDYDRISAAWRHSLRTGDPLFLDRRIRRASGIHEWNRTGIAPTRDKQGRITGWYGATIDLDSHRIAEAELLDRERELSQLVDMVPSHIWRLAPDGEPVFFNRRMVDFLGWDLADIDKADISRLEAVIEAVHPSDAAAFRGVLSRCVVNGATFALRYRLRRADGVYRWMSSRAEPMRDQGGRIVQWYGLCHDIDDQVHAEEMLRERERSLSLLVETLPAMIDCAAPDGEPVYRSQQLREFLGYNLADLDDSGKSRLIGTLDASVHPDDLAGVKERYAHSLATGEPYARKHRLRRFDGEYRWVETRAAPMRDAEGAIAQWNVICLDIDSEVRTQEKLRLAQESLARASQAASLAELSASIAHEVNQPLAAIVANSHACHRWLSAAPPNIDRAKITADRIIRDANSAAEVVSRIRALFKQSVEPRNSTPLHSVIAEAHNLMAEEATRRRVLMDVHVESDLPLIAFDRVQIQQVLVNLIRNGMQAMESTESDRILGVCVRRMGDVVRTEISDRGPGVEFPDKIFDPFFTTKELGMGMGLAICRSIVETHGGRLWVEKNAPHGAAFIFTLPVEAKAAP